MTPTIAADKRCAIWVRLPHFSSVFLARDKEQVMSQILRELLAYEKAQSQEPREPVH
ncbi:hypothetical protein [Calothrix sp. PCC 6303]|uniref:hypothetical protein n=1 Tax=Calothrix sp. PCC 6303 TaxID=1170562 RepID=UPI0002A02DAC|nr:hypothetical protein [Calothrix sp. PCC 6303]AFZ02385.1 hypothetical protein Cal6303_3451 [Calothrix sp. PCC 6303]